ncbi:bifunctional 2',3'-cyclic-nucleotide 2'-phosphodiesterase/3'-nucleotidase [Shimia thalassica]|uniref:bifunctional 2',3'-cyclic-nucleotide 2'-phosphodiesterase/3'-nucleotidase n=1 Tax=Shimia thalassica TaxID=1715693 RepID=UPI0027375CCD|nr:bifunctional 2',3'-cyclic-nucleotide 2'-phosphodiesterase/3'-nucleotidase [Shimia thalassica]MDP2517254.1 bifunctional 2',3'-cyclic-nucleotide 2'-phosphodiesterase/3'-nucleotidase [Shimia thalassica]
MAANTVLNSNSKNVALTVLATSDVHANLLSYDYYADAPSDRPALCRVASLIAAERSKSDNTLLLDNGDFLQGTPLSDLFVDLSPPDTLENPVIAAMNHLKYDAAGLGNHEFNLSLSALKDTLSGANFPCLCANIVPTKAGVAETKGVWQPHVMLERTVTDQEGAQHTIKIGIFGVMPPQVLSWDRSRIGEKLVAHDIVQTARDCVASLKLQGADVIIALAHTGLSGAPVVVGMENAGVGVADSKGIDALVLGHSHLAFPGKGQPDHPALDPENARIHGTPALMPAAGGRFLGKFDLTLSPSEAGWSVTSVHAELLDASPEAATEDPALVEILQPAHNWLLDEIRRPVGRVDQPIHSYFGLLPGNMGVQVVAEAQARYVKAQLSSTPYAELPLLSASAPQKCGGRGGTAHFTDIPAGPIALSHITDLQYFPNDICALVMTGAELVDWLEMSASIYRQILPDQGDQPLLDPDFPPYNSDTILGVRYRIDLSQPARHGRDGSIQAPAANRIHDVQFEGAPIDPAQKFVVAVNNYRAGGGGYVPHITPDRIILEQTTKVRDLITAYLIEVDGRLGKPQCPWTFAPVSGAAVTFPTGPAAHPYLQTSSDVTLVSKQPDGFLRCRYDLA